MTYLRIALQKNLIIDSLIEHLLFSLHLLLTGPLILLQPLKYVWKK